MNEIKYAKGTAARMSCRLTLFRMAFLMFPLCYLPRGARRARRARCSGCAHCSCGREGGGRKVDHFDGDERGCAAVAARATDAAAGNNNTFIHPDSSLVSGMAARYQDMRPPHKNVPAPPCCHTAPKRSYPTLPPYRTKARSPFAVSLSPFHAQKRAPPLQFPAQTRISPLLTQTINIHRPVVFHLRAVSPHITVTGSAQVAPVTT